MELGALKELVSNPRLFVETFIQIEDKDSNLVPFKFNHIQQSIYNGLSGRDIILKPSQVGVTSFLMALFLVDTITTPGTVSVVVAHEEFITQRLLHKAHFFYDSLPPQLKPPAHHRSAYEMTFPDINSVFYIGSARSYVFARGELIHNFLASEVAFWAEPERIITPALQRVRRRLILESTPNGEGNLFHEAYASSKEAKAKGHNTFTTHFFPWWECPEYRLSSTDPKTLGRDRGKLDLDSDEERLIRSKGLDEDQIRWRRMKIAELEQLRRGGEIRRYFWQEFPEDDVTCFLASGDAVYPAEIVQQKLQDCHPPILTHPTGAQVWYPPEENLIYTIAVDPGQARESKTAITVWHFTSSNGRKVPRHCATLVGLIPPDLTAIKAMELARYYNRGLLVVESNAHGLAVIAQVKDYPNIYYRRDLVSGRYSNQLGWATTPSTKPTMISNVLRALPDILCHDHRIWRELLNIRYAGAKTISMGDDDLHDSTAIAVTCQQDHLPKKGFVGTAGWKW